MQWREGFREENGFEGEERIVKPGNEKERKKR